MQVNNNKIAMDALHQMAYPLNYLKEEAVKHGAIFNGTIAIEITKDAQYYQNVAKQALKDIEASTQKSDTSF